MNSQIVTFWQTTLQVGKTAIPYVALVLLIIFAILILVLVLYLLYRFGRRLPIFLRHLGWRCVTLFRRVVGWLRRGRSASQPTVLARFHASSKPTVPLQMSFATGEKIRPWATAPVDRPQDALFLVLGFEGSGKSALLAIGGQAESATTDQLFPACELTWWRLEDGWALEVNQALCSAHHTPKFTHMLKILEQMCPTCPVDGLVVVLSAQQLLQSGKDGGARATLAATSASIASQLGAALPVQLVVSHADSLRGFDELLQLRSATGQREAMLGLRLSVTRPTMRRRPTVALLREAVMGQVLQSLSMQSVISTNFKLRRALDLPAEIDTLQEGLQQFENQLCIDSAATIQPWLQSVALTGFSQSAGPDKSGELVFAGPSLRQQLFLRSVALSPRAAYLAQCHSKTKRAAVLTFVCIASLIVLLVWSRVTWRGMDQNIANVERLLQDIRPELHVAKNASIAFSTSLGTDSLEKLINTVVALDQSTLGFVLVPSSWFSQLRSDALKGVGEIISRTLIRARSEQLATDIPRASDAMLTPLSGVSAQRIEELPAYQDLIAFLDKRELVGASMDSAQRLDKKITYMQLMRFLGWTPEQLKLPTVNWNDAMPVLVTQRFKVEALNSPEINAALRQTLASFWDRLLREALDQHPLVLQSKDVQAGVLNAASGVFGLQDAEALNSSLKKIKRESELPSASRIFDNKKEALAFFAKVQLRLGVSSVVPSGQMIDLTASLEKRFDSLRSKLLRAEVEGIGVLFTDDSRDGSLQLSPDIKNFGSVYANYMSQPFMRPPAKTQVMVAATGRGQYLEWNLSEIEPARILSETLRDYSTGGAQTLAPRIKSGLMRLARTNYERQTDALFLNATHLLEESPVLMKSDADTGRYSGSLSLRQLSLRVSNLATAGKLYQLLRSRDSATSPFSAVSDQLTRESARLLEQFEAELYREDPYAPLIAGVTSWLRSSPNNEMLVSSFKGDIKERLVRSREYVRRQYSSAALPLLELLNAQASGVMPRDVVLRWARLREAIDGYERGNVSNGIYELERYVLSLTKLRDPNECVDFLKERQLPLHRGDYFSQQLAQLDEAVSLACEQRFTQGQRRNYENFANWFNNNIAGRPPFSSTGWHGSHSALAIPLFERVLSRYSEFRKLSLVDKKYPANWPTDVSSFIAQMEQLAVYFLTPQSAKEPTSMMTSGTTKVAAPRNEVRPDMPFRLRLEFRSSRMHEAGADQIIDWSIYSGGRHYSNRGNDLFQWKVGEPIEVQLRWASNSTVSPLALVSKVHNYSVGERTAKFKYSGDWALFELLERHKSAGLNVDGGVALFFPVPTIGPKGRQDAKAFITMLPPDGVNALLPDFPALAPLFPHNGGN
jgi:hypothetical protein